MGKKRAGSGLRERAGRRRSEGELRERESGYAPRALPAAGVGGGGSMLKRAPGPPPRCAGPAGQVGGRDARGATAARPRAFARRQSLFVRRAFHSLASHLVVFGVGAQAVLAIRRAGRRRHGECGGRRKVGGAARTGTQRSKVGCADKKKKKRVRGGGGGGGVCGVCGGRPGPRAVCECVHAAGSAGGCDPMARRGRSGARVGCVGRARGCARGCARGGRGEHAARPNGK